MGGKSHFSDMMGLVRWRRIRWVWAHACSFLVCREDDSALAGQDLHSGLSTGVIADGHGVAA